MVCSRRAAGILTGLGILLAGCSEPDAGRAGGSPEAHGPLAPTGWADLQADLMGVDGQAIGSVAIAAAPHGILLRLEVTGLSPGWHGMHLHAVGDCADAAEGFKASQGHVNPGNAAHGLLEPAGAEAGDLPNIFAHADGRAVAEVYRDGVQLEPGPGGPDVPVLLDGDGFAVVVHQGPDDHASQPIGGAGGRVACAAFRAASP